MMDLFDGFKRTCYEVVKYFAATLMMIATLCMFSPHLASASTIPWILYLIANAIWLYDSRKEGNKPWVTISLGFVVLDVMLIIARL